MAGKPLPQSPSLRQLTSPPDKLCSNSRSLRYANSHHIPDGTKRNARTHSKKQIRQIADSIVLFGVTNPLLVDHRGTIVAGHARVQAAKLLGLKMVPVIRLSSLNEAEIRAWMIADNKLSQNAGWDREMLALQFEELKVTLPEVGLDLEITGFSRARSTRL
jgi:ParB-like chromosome segregation protein Spo0J